MKAVALTRYLPIDDPQALFDVELPEPEPGPHDLLVDVEAISVNPVDTKVRAPKDRTEPQPRVLGWDAAGRVLAVGRDVRGFQPGDAVYYAGDLTRPGCNAQRQCVDARIAALRPQRLSAAESAALPLTALTAYEALFDGLGIDVDGGRDVGKSLLIIGAAGGVGSIALQLARLAGLRVIGSVSRDATRAWVASLGLTETVDHRQPLPPQLAALGVPEVDYILNCASSDQYWSVCAELLRPRGKACSIVENRQALDQSLYKNKSLSHVWEFMFTRSMYRTADMEQQGHILQRIAAWIDTGTLRSTLHDHDQPICAATLRAAHAELESGRSIGKRVLSGWPRL